jgi:anti-sigma regulatory factor (Ser/Thr protein kinase)
VARSPSIVFQSFRTRSAKSGLAQVSPIALTADRNGGRRAVTALTLTPETSNVAVARRYVRDLLADAGVSDSFAYPAVLATSELVTNAVLHAGTRVDLCVEITDGTLRVEVVDYGDGCPVYSRVASDADRGRGLMVVSRVATRWGVDLESDRKSIWFELPSSPLPHPGSRRPSPSEMLSQLLRVICRLRR